MQIQRPRWSSSTKLVVTLLLLALGIYLLSRFKEAIGPFIIALILAYVISPIVRWVEKRLKLQRVPAILVAYLATLALLAGPDIGIDPHPDDAIQRAEPGYAALYPRSRSRP